MKKAVIGVVPLMDANGVYPWMKPNYISAIQDAGGVALILPLTAEGSALDDLVAACDGFLVTGGVDLNPALYGEENLPACSEGCDALDSMEMALLPRILAADKPMLGICRGLQALNVALGGALWQDIPSQHPSVVQHRMEAPYDRFVHRAIQQGDTPLRRIIPAETFEVNSAHHQGIRTLGAGLVATACCEDGLTEAVCMPEKRFVHAVQWHPEDLFRMDTNAAALFRALVNACGNK